MRHELRFRAMGAGAVVIVHGDAGLLAAARRRVEDLEDRWSRFRSGELTRANALAGRPVRVSEETFLLVERSVAAWRLTDGAFDPTVRDALLAHGYDRTFDEVAGGPSGGSDGAPAPGLGDAVVDETARTVLLPAGVGLDPGGIGKGLAADIVTAELMARGAEGALVGLGGDVRARGAGPEGDWIATVEDPYRPSRELARIAIGGSGVATSSRLRRVWRRGASVVHHLIDPSTGRPAAGDVDAASVVAGSAWWAEALATALVARGRAPGFETLRRASAIVVDRWGRRHTTPDLLGCLS